MESFNGNTTAKEVAAYFTKNIGNKTALITGTSTGSIGSVAAKELASAKHLILVGRNEAKAAAVMDDIRATNSNVKVTFVRADLASNESVRRAAAELNSLPGLDHIDILINAAGNMAVRDFTTSTDGVELQFAANHLGHFLMTSLIMDKILAAPAPTVVNLTSMGYELGEIQWDDVNFEGGKNYKPWPAYAQAKTANILHAAGLRYKFADKGLATFAVHPGYSQLQASNGVDTDLMIEGYQLAVARNNGQDVPVQATRTLQEGCATVLLAALDSSLRGKLDACLT
ncbi:putative short-chain dehydrogenase [Xylariaceae sp. FL0255]|nr:putative short-chain dehydrogenase [Xylariaceae sp. FL0255]